MDKSGMTGFKKVSDFLIDEIVSLIDKDEVTVIESAGEIVWVVGRRIDERVRQTQSNKSLLLSLS